MGRFCRNGKGKSRNKVSQHDVRRDIRRDVRRIDARFYSLLLTSTWDASEKVITVRTETSRLEVTLVYDIRQKRRCLQEESVIA
jgi:hypothetical protein